MSIDNKSAETLLELKQIRLQREKEIANRFSALKKEGFKAGEATYFSQRCGEFVSEDGKSLYLFSHLNKKQCEQIGAPFSPQIYKVTMKEFGYTTVEMPSFQGGLASLTFRYDSRPEAYDDILINNLPDCMPSKVYEDGFEYPTIDCFQLTNMLRQFALIPQIYTSSTRSSNYYFGAFGENSAVCPETWKLDIQSIASTMANNKSLEGFVCQKAQEFGLEPPMDYVSEQLGLPELVKNYSLTEAYDILMNRLSSTQDSTPQTNPTSITPTTEDCQ